MSVFRIVFLSLFVFVGVAGADETSGSKKVEAPTEEALNEEASSEVETLVEDDTKNTDGTSKKSKKKLRLIRKVIIKEEEDGEIGIYVPREPMVVGLNFGINRYNDNSDIGWMGQIDVSFIQSYAEIICSFGYDKKGSSNLGTMGIGIHFNTTKLDLDDKKRGTVVPYVGFLLDMIMGVDYLATNDPTEASDDRSRRSSTVPSTVFGITGELGTRYFVSDDVAIKLALAYSSILSEDTELFTGNKTEKFNTISLKTGVAVHF